MVNHSPGATVIILLLSARIIKLLQFHFAHDQNHFILDVFLFLQSSFYNRDNIVSIFS